MRRVGVIVFPGYGVMNLAAMSVFDTANSQADAPIYDVQILSETGGPVRTSIGMMVDTMPFDDMPYDTLLIGGGVELVPATPAVVRFVRQSLSHCRRVASICTGAFVLAQAGLLEGRRATTHWKCARALQTQYPGIRVEEDRIFIHDGPVWTSAGMSAGIDLALALVEEDLGVERARGIAKKLVLYHRRSGGQSQFSALLELEPKSDRIQSALVYARNRLHMPLSVPQLAEAARLSPRQFSRAFHAETGQSPAKAIENLRVEAARLMMEEGRHSIDVVARQTGFADPERMRRAFLRAFGQPPQVIRRNARTDLPPPIDRRPMPAE